MMSVKKGDQIQMNDCDQHNEGNNTYSLRKSKLLENEKMNKLEDAIHYIRIKRDQKGFIVKMVNEDIGKGVFAIRDFATGSFLLEYDGELINVAEGRQREKSYPLDLGSYIFFFQHKSKKFCIDATFSKRKGRFVNDGIEKEQNSVMKLIDVDNRPHLALFALKNISKGEEIRYDYGVPNLPWRTKRMNKKKCADKEDIQTSDSGVSKKSSERENETVETMKDCRIDLVRLSSETIQGFLTGCRTQGNYFQRASGNESLVVERKSHIIESISEESLFARQEEQNLSSSQMESQIKECMFETSVLAQDEKMEEHNSNCKVDSIENHIPMANVLHENQEGQNFDSLMASQIEESISETTPLIMGEDQQNSSFLLESKRVESQFVQIEDEGGQTLNCMVDQPKNDTPKTNFLNESQEEHTLISQNAVVEDISEISHLAQDKDGEGQDYNCRLESQKVEKICKKNSLVDNKCQKPHNFKCTVESQEEEYILETNPLVLDDDQEGQKCRSEKANETILEEVEGPLLQLDDHVTRAQERKVICSEHEFDDTMQIIGEDNIGNLMEEKEFETGEGKMQIFDKETQASVNYFSETDRLTEDEGQETHTEEADHSDKDGEMIDDNVTENSHMDFCDNELTTTSKESTETLEKEFFSCVEKLLNSEFVKERLTRDSTGKPNFLVETLGKLKVHLASPSKTSAHIAKAQPSLHEAQIDDTEGIENNQENVEIVLEEDKESQDKVEHANVDGENKNKKTIKKGTSKPKRPCPFCGKFVGDLTKHLKSRIHKDEEEVKAALAMKKQERNHAFSLLRRKGYNKVNIERIREHGDDAEMITERKRGLDKEHAICSLCNGMFVKAFMSRHKRRCKVAESTTSAPVSIPVNAIVEDKLTQDFKEKVLTKFLNNEVGNLCRTDTFIRQFGNHRYKRAVARIDKRIEIRVNTMSEMRRLAGLYLCYKKEAEKEKIETTSAADLFRRKHFDLLEDALSEFTTDGDGKLKSGLRRGLGYLLKKAAMYLKGHALQQNNEDEFNEMGKFLVLFQHNYPSLFDAAEYNCLKARQKKLRRPARLPEESDVATLRDYNLAEIRRLVSDEYKLLNNHEYIRLRDCVVCRLTLFNARRGGEPSRLDLSEWEDAKKNVWLTKDCESVTDDLLEKMLLGRFKLAYQSGKNIKDMVPNLIPEDCWLALLKLADPGIRHAANITVTNEYLFPSEQSELHVSGWYCCDRACKKAGISKTITATDMRHRASTLYAGLDVSDSDRQIFYKHMGHSAEINRDVYQCPMGAKEITKVGRFLARIDGQSLDDIMKASEVKCNGENVHSEPSGSQKSINDPQPSTSGQSRFSTIDEVNSLLSQHNIQAFLEPLVDEHVMLRAVSGRGLIDEDEVETIPGNLKVAKRLLCDPSMQKKVRQYFTDDGWTTAISTIRIMEEYDAVEKRQPTKSKRKRKVEEDSDDSFELNESDCSSDEDVYKLKKYDAVEKRQPTRSKRKRKDSNVIVIYKVEEDSDDSFELNESDCSSDEDVYKLKSAERKGKKLVQKSSVAKQKERQYYQWKEQESEIVKEYFKENINDISSLDSKGSIPGKKAIKQFLDKHPILNELEFEERIWKVKTKILNERKTIRQKVKKTLDKYVQRKRYGICGKADLKNKEVENKFQRWTSTQMSGPGRNSKISMGKYKEKMSPSYDLQGTHQV